MESLVVVLLPIGVAVFAYAAVRARNRNARRTRIAPRNGKAKILRPFDSESAEPEPAGSAVCGSAYVVDGDTLVIRKTQIRLFGIDAPEMDHPYGNKAKWALVSLCKGHAVRAEITERDDYGRTVARCFLPDGRDLSAEMVKLGLAIDWPKFSGGVYRSLEVPEVRRRLWLADARQKGRMHVWRQFEAKQKTRRKMH